MLFDFLLQVSVNGEDHIVGTVVYDKTNNDTVIAGIVLGIIAALVAGAGFALFVMRHLREKERGEGGKENISQFNIRQ